jgi:hypothetical protein
MAPVTVPSVLSKALQIQMKTGPRSRIWPSVGRFRTELPKGTTVSNFTNSAETLTDPKCRQEAQEAPRTSRETGGIILSLTTSDATTSTRSEGECSEVQEKPKDHPPTVISKKFAKRV